MFKVIIVEDEEIIRHGLELSIDWLSMGCVVVGTAENGNEGLKLILDTSPDIVITDIKMPILSGIDMLSKAIKQRDFFSIILTSYAEFEYAKKAIDIGTSEYILKPVDDSELRCAIESIGAKISEKKHYKKLEELVNESWINGMEDCSVCSKAESAVDYYVRETYRIIKENYTEKLSINDVADRLKVSSSYISRKLKQTLSITFVDLLNQYRIKQALILLNNGNLMIYEVSDMVGFSDYKYFCSVFKKYTNLSPSEFQKSNKYLIF